MKKSRNAYVQLNYHYRHARQLLRLLRIKIPHSDHLVAADYQVPGIAVAV